MDAVMEALTAHHANDEVLQDIAINHILFVPRKGWIVVYELFGAPDLEKTTNCGFVCAGLDSKIIWTNVVK
jgi:hypothetical protein